MTEALQRGCGQGTGHLHNIVDLQLDGSEDDNSLLVTTEHEGDRQDWLIQSSALQEDA